MNRRKFLESLFKAAAIVVAAPQIDFILRDSAHMSDEEFIEYDFVAYLKVNLNIYIANPSQCAYIDGITECH